jgi:AraC-like DNA-binding protein
MSTVAKSRTLNQAFAAKAQSATRALLNRCAAANSHWQQLLLQADPRMTQAKASIWSHQGTGSTHWEATTPQDAYAVLLLLDNARLSLRSDAHELHERACDAGSYYVSRPGESVSVKCPGNCRALYVELPVQLFWSADEASHACFSMGPAHDALLLQLARTLLEMHGESREHALATQVLELIVDRLRHLRAAAAPLACAVKKTVLPQWRLQRVDDYVKAHLSESITLNDMATAAGLSPMHFAAQFRAATGLRPHHYLLLCRMEHAKQLIAEMPRSMLDVALEVGFHTQAHFTTVFKRLTGKTPSQWRGDALRAQHV